MKHTLHLCTLVAVAGLGGKDGYIGGREGMRTLRSVQIQHFGRK